LINPGQKVDCQFQNKGDPFWLLPSVQFGLVGKRLWPRLAPRWRSAHSGIVPVRPKLVAEIRYFGRYRNGWLRDGVRRSVG
jgi:hypothetical protein